MKFGMNLLLWSGEFGDDMVPVCQQLKDLGYDGVELPIFNTDLDYAAIGKQLDSIGLARTAVCVRNEEDNPISPDPAVRAAGVAANKQTLDCCAAAGRGNTGGALPLCDRHTSAVPDRPMMNGNGVVDSMRQVAEHAGEVGVKLGVEALNRFECYLLNTHADSTRFVREVDHPACGMMYDTFHSQHRRKVGRRSRPGRR